MRLLLPLLLLASSASALLVAPLAPRARVAARTSTLRAAEDREVSDAETALRWIGVQGAVDSTIVLVFAYDCYRKLGDDFSFEAAISQPGLKFLILMPALTTFLQILRRFGADDCIVTRYRPFEEDPIVKYLGGAEKVRDLRRRWTEISTIKG